MALNELDVIDRFLRPLAGEGAFGLFDDAARLTPSPGTELVLTTDMIAAGIHFLPDDPPFTIAQKALRVNISDLAAKGADPVGYLMSLALSPDLDSGWLEAFCLGLAADQAAFGIDLLGGDTISIRQGPVVSITAIGAVPAGGMVHRFGGRPGDVLFVSGAIGAARAGLALLTGERGPWDSIPAGARDGLVARYRVPEPRLGLAEAVRSHASAAMDVSDGLVGDCDKMVASTGCSARLDGDRVPVDAALAGLAEDDRVFAALVSGGDDYEILAAVPPDAVPAFVAAAGEAGIAVSRIGALVEGAGPVTIERNGRILDLRARAYVHGGQGERHV
ncbi:thiamine-phosphate kinase [Propylenella binzhouense]|uniref:thiamine-phosphate kinase n=1 Tax=Propylenella binzhouense TaxID=2555902 RepID=UPI001967098F|nr:thiamine-phosphate kinase [Propylenella binzhouense]